MALHDLSEGTKHGLDIASALAPVTTGTAAVLTLNEVAAVMAILASACSIIWFLIRLRDRIKYGHSGDGE